MPQFSRLLARLGALPGFKQPPPPLDGTITVLNPRPTTHKLSAVTYGAGTFVAVGAGGTILTSPDGAAWTERASSVTSDLYAATYGDARFVVAGDNGTVLVSSDEGVTWQAQNMGSASSVRGATFGGGQFYLVSRGGYVYRTDGASWPATQSALVDGMDWSLTGIATSGSLFVVITGNGHIFTSSHLNAWANDTPKPAPRGLGSVVWSGTQFVATASRDHRTYTSADGMTWHDHPAGRVSFTGLAYGAGRYVAGDAGNCALVTAKDGQSWAPYSLGESDAPNGVAFGADRFVLVGDNGLVAIYALPTAPTSTPGPQ